MMKKTYNKPAITIVLLNSGTHLLTTSGYKVNSDRNGGRTTVGDDEDSHEVKNAFHACFSATKIQRIKEDTKF